MSSTSCPRLFEVEAARDGRLGDAELASFERHKARCSVCSREAHALDALAASLRGLPEPRADELHARRERTRLLTAFDRAATAPERCWPGGRWLWGLPIALIATGLVVAGALRRAPAAGAPCATIHAQGKALWSERVQRDVERVRLDRGSLWIHVDHSASRARRLVVVLPDGTLRDTGTTFTVAVRKGHTTRVAVQEGSVVLRLRGRLGVVVEAGETWAPNAPAHAASCASATLPAPSGGAPRLVPSSRPALHAPSPLPARPAASAAPALDALPANSAPLTGARRAIAPSGTSSAAPDPSLAFRAAMDAFNAGDNALAAAAFGRFVVQHPHDAQAQDAAYLRVIALRKAGDSAAMKRAARDYLRRYPNGFRRTEVRALAE